MANANRIKCLFKKAKRGKERKKCVHMFLNTPPISQYNITSIHTALIYTLFYYVVAVAVIVYGIFPFPPKEKETCVTTLVLQIAHLYVQNHVCVTRRLRPHTQCIYRTHSKITAHTTFFDFVSHYANS